MPADTPFLRFEDKFHFLSEVVTEAQLKLSTVSARGVADLAVGALVESLFEFCDEQFHAIRKLRPTIMRHRGKITLASGSGINDLFRPLVKARLVSVAESNRLRTVTRYSFGPSRGADEKRARFLDWTDTSGFVFELAVHIARETGSAAKRGLDSKKQKHRRLVAAASRLLVARYDNLV